MLQAVNTSTPLPPAIVNRVNSASAHEHAAKVASGLAETGAIDVGEMSGPALKRLRVLNKVCLLRSIMR